MCDRNLDWLPLACPQRGTGPDGTQAPALTGTRTNGLLICRTTPNPLSLTSQGRRLEIFVPTFVHIYLLELFPMDALYSKK